jgi:AcrR family transcriptional regulator
MRFMTSYSSPEHRKDALRRTILDAARETFTQEGHQYVSMRRLANKIGYSAGSLYLHFKSKEEILDCLVEESFGRLAASLAALRQRSENKDPVETLRKAMYTYVDFGLRNANDYRLALLAQPAARMVPQSVLAVHAVLQTMVGRCVDEGRFRAASVELTSQALWAAVHGITSLLIQQAAYPWSGRDLLVQQVVGNAISAVQAEGTLADSEQMDVNLAVA